MPNPSAILFPNWTYVTPNPSTSLREIRRNAFQYPFYNDGVSKFKQAGDLTGELDPDESMDDSNMLELKGFIFHTSHCGSTLLSRMMSVLPRVRIVSETEAINGLLLAFLYHQLPREQIAKHLRAIIERYRQKLEDDEEYLIFKTTSWNIFQIDFFQTLYPDVPWIYIDRDTEKAVDSSLRDGYGFVQWWDFPTDLPRKFFLAPEDAPEDKRSYVKRIIERQRIHAEQHKSGQNLFLRYPGFIGEFETQILPHFGLEYSEEELMEAREMTKYKSKSFEPEPFEKKLDR